MGQMQTGAPQQNMSALPAIATAKADIVPHNPKSSDETTPPDETPATFAELKPPGYWSATLGYFVPVQRVSDEKFWERSFLPDCTVAIEWKGTR
jgi:hypothetical protein